MESLYEKAAAGLFGVVFVVTLLVLAVRYPHPTPFQYLVFRVTLALAAAGIAPFIPGLLNVEVGTAIKAGGAIAVFVVVYFFSPARLLAHPVEEASLQALVDAWHGIEAPDINALDARMAHRAFNAMKLQASYWRHSGPPGKALIVREGLDPYRQWYLALDSADLQMTNGKSARANLAGELTDVYREMTAHG